MSRYDRLDVYRRWAFSCLAAAIVSALLATWLWDQQWALTAGVFLFAAFVLGIVAIP